mmetsp:Transcript_53842/g.123537  ORF Transcript_53842/g.123537 Transcript_53842/m.123537 type:complete len:215 (-) Transcript_53842:182-826(-)
MCEVLSVQNSQRLQYHDGNVSQSQLRQTTQRTRQRIKRSKRHMVAYEECAQRQYINDFSYYDGENTQTARRAAVQSHRIEAQPVGVFQKTPRTPTKICSWISCCSCHLASQCANEERALLDVTGTSMSASKASVGGYRYFFATTGEWRLSFPSNTRDCNVMPLGILFDPFNSDPSSVRIGDNISVACKYCDLCTDADTYCSTSSICFRPGPGTP